jgi:hypothetical protein
MPGGEADEEHAHRLIIETRGDAVALICSECARPFITAENGEVTILNKHGKSQHSNKLTISDWRWLGVLLEAQQRTGKNPPIW